MSDQSKPIVIDIEIKKVSPVKTPSVAWRLGSHFEAAPTLEEINERLLRAELNRKEEMARRARLADDKRE
jgi:guanylate kinase